MKGGVLRVAEPFLAEIRLMSFSVIPRGWALCNGQLLPINQNQALFSLLGTNYGGDGRTNFALPDLRGRVPIHTSADYSLGSRGGAETHTLTESELPAHTHAVNASTVAGNSGFANFAGTGHVLAPDPGAGFAASAASSATLNPASVATAGSSQAHANMQPYLTISFCIALQGIFPSQN